MPTSSREKPSALVKGVFPDGTPKTGCAAAAATLARRLRGAIGGRTLREAERITGVDHSTIGRILAGEVWPDLSTIASLELGLDVDLLSGWRQER